MLRRSLLAALILFCPVSVLAEPAPGTPITIGPPVGSQIPTLVARDGGGMARDLASVSGRNGVVLAFFRSARWCPYCQRQLIDLEALQAPLAARGYGLAAISYDQPAILAAFAQKRGVHYVLLSDDGSRMIDAFRLRDPQYPASSFAYGVPRPAIFVVNPKGVVQAKLALDGYKVRPSNDAVLEAVDGLK